MGVRIGTSEVYRAVESVPEVKDSLAISVDSMDRQTMILFVTLVEGAVLDDGLVRRIRDKVKTDLSPKYVPDEVVAVPEFPQTLNGKKLEVPVRRVFMGIEPSKAVNLDTLANPTAMEYFVTLAKAWKQGKKL
jgi:acetoacetyl-CoA synthetase